MNMEEIKNQNLLDVKYIGTSKQKSLVPNSAYKVTRIFNRSAYHHGRPNGRCYTLPTIPLSNPEVWLVALAGISLYQPIELFRTLDGKEIPKEDTNYLNNNIAYGLGIDEIKEGIVIYCTRNHLKSLIYGKFYTINKIKRTRYTSNFTLKELNNNRYYSRYNFKAVPQTILRDLEIKDIFDEDDELKKRGGTDLNHLNDYEKMSLIFIQISKALDYKKKTECSASLLDVIKHNGLKSGLTEKDFKNISKINWKQFMTS